VGGTRFIGLLAHSVGGMGWAENPHPKWKRKDMLHSLCHLGFSVPSSRRVRWGLSYSPVAQWTEKNVGMHGLSAHPSRCWDVLDRKSSVASETIC
jgi:hypothetical protein